MLKRIREWINIRLYNNKKPVLRTFRITSFILAIISILILAYLNGYPQTPESSEIMLDVIRGILLFFILNYFTRIFYSFRVFNFLKRNWLEGLLVLLLIYDGLSQYFFEVPLLHYVFQGINVKNFTAYYVIFLQFYMVVMAGLELIKNNEVLANIRIKPAMSLILSLFLLSFVGAGLLMMPNMTTQEGSMDFLEALFTSVSAISQTGLILQDTGSFFTFRGQVVIMLLIQIGALGIISFGSFFGAYLSRNATLKQQHSFHDFFLSDSSEDSTTNLFGNIILYTLVIDVLGAVLLYFQVGDAIPFNNQGDKIFFALFHSVSAFNNAGFSTLDGGMYHHFVQDAFLLHIGIILLVFLGSLGYPTLIELFGIRQLRERMRKPWKGWSLDTKVSLYTSLGLVVFGAVVFYLVEIDNTMTGMQWQGAAVTSTFQSVVRTAGFNTVDISALSAPTLILFCFLMFVGGSSGSMCGGIRTSTFTVSLLSFYNALKGGNKVTLWNRRIPEEVIFKSISIIMSAAGFVFLCVLALTFTDPNIPLMDLVFEEISAFGTVGLSTGITTELSTAGRIIIMISMFIGRVGTLSLVVALSTQLTTRTYKYPDTNIMIG